MVQFFGSLSQYMIQDEEAYSITAMIHKLIHTTDRRRFPITNNAMDLTIKRLPMITPIPLPITKQNNLMPSDTIMSQHTGRRVLMTQDPHLPNTGRLLYRLASYPNHLIE